MSLRGHSFLRPLVVGDDILDDRSSDENRLTTTTTTIIIIIIIIREEDKNYKNPFKIHKTPLIFLRKKTLE